MVEPGEYGKHDNTIRGGGMGYAGWDPLPEALMRARMIHVVHVLGEHSPQVSFTEDQQVVQAFTPYPSHKPFTHSVRSGCLHGCVQNCDSSGKKRPGGRNQAATALPEAQLRSLSGTRPFSLPRCHRIRMTT